MRSLAFLNIQLEPKEVAEALAWPAIEEITIHVEPAEHPFDRVDRPVLIAVELLEMVVGQCRIVRVWNTGANAMFSARIVALGAFQHTVVHEIGARLHNSFRRLTPMNFHLPMVL